MKPIKQTLMSGAMILALSLVFTSCEDILGEWSKPAPVIVTPDDNGGGSTEGIAYVKYTVSGTTATPSDQRLAEGTYTVVTADLAELTADKPYVVNDDITIGHDVTISDDAEIILCDGKTLTINGYLGKSGPLKSLIIYGQSGQTGKLIVQTNDGNYPICVAELNIHGGIISAKDVGTGTNTLGIYTANDFNIYNGKVEAFGTMEGVAINSGAELKVYGGSLEATTSVTTWAAGQGSVALQGIITVYGGTVTATGGDANVAGKAGGAGINGTLIVNGGTVTATGGKGANGAGTSPAGGKGGAGISGNVTVSGTATVIATGGRGGDGYDADDGTGGTGGNGLAGDLNNASPNVTITGGAGGNAGTRISSGTNSGGSGGDALYGTPSGSATPIMTNGTHGADSSV